MIKREKFSINVDIWALGCVLYILLCGSHPFDPTGETPDAQILSQVVNGDYDKSNAQYLKLSDSARDLIFHMLEKDPAKRYTIHQVLQHPWITESHSDSATTFSREYFDRIRGFRIVTLMKSGMMDLLGKAENDMFNALDVDGVRVSINTQQQQQQVRLMLLCVCVFLFTYRMGFSHGRKLFER